MENENRIISDFGTVPCGQKTTETVKIKNPSKKSQVLAVSTRSRECEMLNDRLQIVPLEILAKPGQTVRFTLAYVSFVENLIENYHYEILNFKEVVAQLNIRAKTIGPSITPTVFNLKFFRVHGLDKTVRQVNLTNKANCEAKFFFDLDEDFDQLQISQRSGVIPACHKLGLKFTFKPSQAGVYFKRIFCIVQFHEPLIFNILAIYKPKSKLELKNLTFNYPPELEFSTNFESYISRAKGERMLDGEAVRLSQIFSQELESALRGSTLKSEEEVEENTSSLLQPWDSVSVAESKPPTENILLTVSYLNIGNAPEVTKATALINLSEAQVYYYEWDLDPKNHFQIFPFRGVLNPKSHTYFTVSFTPSVLDFMYHAELDVKVFLCRNENEPDSPNAIDLPLTLSFRIIGNSFPDDSCGWVAQCKASPKSLHLRACVPGENVSGTFLIERQGHLPVTFHVVPPKQQNFIVQPTLGYLSKSFQLLVVHFSSEGKEPGIYTEYIKIKFNNSDSCFETVRLCAHVEIPTLVMENEDSVTFNPVAPGARSSRNVKVENPTNLNLRYEFVIPEDITWVEVVKPKGSVNPKDFGEVKVVFRPTAPGEYLDYIPCFISSISEIEYTQTMYLQLIGSCQFGFLVATPSFYDFGNCIIREKKTTKIHLYNFSPIMLYFNLRPVCGDFPLGDPRKDMEITPVVGKVPGKSSLEVNVKIKPHEVGSFRYAIECQNVEEDSGEPGPLDDPRRIFYLKFQGVMQVTQVIDVALNNAGPLFSPHWLWKMLDVKRLNDSLKVVNKKQTVKLCVPEGTEDTQPIVLSVAFESGGYGDILWDYKVEINCPCLEGSTRSFSEGLECVHTKAVFFPTSPSILSPRTRLIAQIVIKYDEPSDCEVGVTITSRNRMVSLKIPITVLPKDRPSRASFYLDRPFEMKQVFIGDPDPSVQLFWMYNNTHYSTYYSLDQQSFMDSCHFTSKVFECINPFGVIPPFSSYPLAFIFTPKESKDYTENVTVILQDNKSRNIKLRGRGALSVNQFKELAVETTVPTKSHMHNDSLECSQRHIIIYFMRTFSHSTRLFFLRNDSKTQKWAFRWHSFYAENLFYARVKPEKGVIEPQRTALMTLYVQSYCHPTSISASIPCDILNYSEFTEYQVSLVIQKIKEAETEECFTITEKGETRKPQIVVPVVPEPKPRHVFLTVSVNLVSGLYVDLKLSPNQQSTMQAERELCAETPVKEPLEPAMLKFSQELLEKLFWNILCSSSVRKCIKNLAGTQDYVYLELTPETVKTREESLERLRTIPKKNYVQRFLETLMKEVLCKNFIPEECLINSAGE